MAKLYANENFPVKAVQNLRALGHDVLTVFEAGNAEKRIPDEQVLVYAITQERAVITINRRDFIRLHDLFPEHYGVIVCTQDGDVIGLAQRIHAAIVQAGSLKGQLIRVVRPLR